MNPRLARRLLGLSFTALVAYCYGRVEASFGIIPLLFFTTVGVVCWAAGYAWAARQFADTTARSNRERDEVARLLVQQREGRPFEAISLEDIRRRQAMDKHPSAVAKRGRA